MGGMVAISHLLPGRMARLSSAEQSPQVQTSVRPPYSPKSPSIAVDDDRRIARAPQAGQVSPGSIFGTCCKDSSSRTRSSKAEICFGRAATARHSGT